MRRDLCGVVKRRARVETKPRFIRVRMIPHREHSDAVFPVSKPVEWESNMVDTTDAHAGSANPYQPPESPPVLAGMSGRFACPKCSESLPFLRLWLLQPLGRCPYCRTRLLVRRHGWHKIWTPALVLVMLWSAFLLAVLIGVRALFFFFANGADHGHDRWPDRF